MDPLSITLSITALLKLTKDVVIYVKEVKDHVDERRSFVRETSSLSGMLNTLVHFVNEDPDKSWLHATSDLLSRGGPFDQYSSALQSLKAKIVPGSSARMLTQVLLWRNIKQDVQDVLSKIERLKTIVGIALDLDHMSVSSHPMPLQTWLILIGDFRVKSNLISPTCLCTSQSCRSVIQPFKTRLLPYATTP